MEKQIKTLYYIGMEEKEDGLEDRRHFWLRGSRKSCRKKSREPLALYRSQKRLVCGNTEIRLYFSLLPGSFLEKTGKRRKKERWLEQIRSAVFQMEDLSGFGGFETVFDPRILESWGRSQEQQKELPQELFGVCLAEKAFSKSLKALSHISLSLPEESGPLAAENALRVLEPFLPRINVVVFVGEEGESAWQVEDFLYDEYGILMTYDKRPEKNTVWIDLDGDEKPLLENYALENGVYHLNAAEALKFLDTAAKNGYNTKVN